MVTKEEILTKLKTVLDPELHINVVDLGLIYNVSVKDGKVKLLLTLTTPGCPLAAYFDRDLKDKIKEVPGVKEVDIELTFDPPWNPSKMSEDAREQLGVFL